MPRRTLSLLALVLTLPFCAVARGRAAGPLDVRSSAPTPCAEGRVRSVADMRAAAAAEISRPAGAEKTSDVADGIAPLSEGASFRAANFFDGGRTAPPSIGADVGPTQILVALDGRVRVFDKTGNVGDLDVSAKVFWDVDFFYGGTDEQVRFDPTSDRWFVYSSFFYGFALAVSDGPEITSRTDFTFYTFAAQSIGEPGNADTNGSVYNTSMSVDANAVYIGADVYRPTQPYSGASLFVIRKSSAIEGRPLVASAFRFLDVEGARLFGPVAVENDDPTATDGYFLSAYYDGVNTALRFFRVADPGGTPRLDADTSVAVPAYTPFGIKPIPLRESLKPIEAEPTRLMQASLGRNALTGERAIWTSHVVTVTASGALDATADRSAVRWYEIGNLEGQPALLQTGTIYDSAATSPRGYTTPSVAMTGQGNAVLAFSGGSAATYSQVYVAAQVAGDPAGAMRGPAVALTSAASYNPYSPTPNAPTQDWPEYSTTVVDPADGMTAWTFQPYVDGTDAWAVRAIEIEAPAPATIVSLSPSSASPGATTEILVSGVSTDGTGFFDAGDGHARRLTASVGGEGVTVEGVRFVDATHVAITVSVAPGAPVGPRDVTVTNPDGQSVTASALLGVGPSVTGVRVAKNAAGVTQLVVSGTDLVAGSLVSVDGVFFAKPPKLKNGSLVQKGKLGDGRTIDRAIPPGATVTIGVTTGGVTTTFTYTRPA